MMESISTLMLNPLSFFSVLIMCGGPYDVFLVKNETKGHMDKNMVYILIDIYKLVPVFSRSMCDVSVRNKELLLTWSILPIQH